MKTTTEEHLFYDIPLAQVPASGTLAKVPFGDVPEEVRDVAFRELSAGWAENYDNMDGRGGYNPVYCGRIVVDGYLCVGYLGEVHHRRSETWYCPSGVYFYRVGDATFTQERLTIAEFRRRRKW